MSSCSRRCGVVVAAFGLFVFVWCCCGVGMVVFVGGCNYEKGESNSIGVLLPKSISSF